MSLLPPLCGGGVVNSSVDSSDDEVVSVHSAPLFGVGVCDDSPNFSDHNDMMPDLPTDNEVSKYSFYSRLSHYMEGCKISESNHVAEIRSRVDLPLDFCKTKSRSWQLGGAAEWINATPPHE